jgi:phosphoglycolate phosphatase-like HAD superfamily hydrolase
MTNKSTQSTIAAGILYVLAATTTVAQAADPLPSWNDGKTKQSILTFVSKVTKEGSPEFVPPAKRIATFDNDGTLWAEQPMYFQLQFGIDRIKELAPQHPEWQSQEPFKSVLAGDLKTAFAGGAPALVELMAAGHSNMTTEEFDLVLSKWLASAKHPKTGRLYTEMVYQPMIELLAYLRANGFKTYIVSGGGADFMRGLAEQVYGIPPEQVIGSEGKLKFEMRDGKPVLFKVPALDYFDDKEGKPIAIEKTIGRRPIAAFGNSDGDLQMLQWSCLGGAGTRFCLFVRHTDAEREWAYDISPVGRLEKGLEEAKAYGWTVVDMKADWKVIYPFERK